MKRIFAVLGPVAALLLVMWSVWSGLGVVYEFGRLTAMLETPVEAQAGPQALAGADAYEYDSLTVSTVAVSLTAAKVSPLKAPSAKLVILTIETADLRYRYDGVADPTAAEGHAAVMGATLVVSGINNIRRFRMIRSGGTSAVVKVTYLR